MTLKQIIEWHEEETKHMERCKRTDEIYYQVLCETLRYLRQVDNDGCTGCVFEDVEEWEMPCAKCKRGCKDYWRRAKE